MHTRPLGNSGIQASVVGFGACPIGGWLWGQIDLDASIRTIHAALDQGINLIDTAPGYGLGRSEQIIGQALRGRRDDAVIVTKCGLVWHNDLGTFRFDQDGTSIYHHLHPDSIRYEIEESLRRLSTDYIDLYLTHWPDVNTPIQDTMAALLALKDEGKIRAIGASNVTMGDMRSYCDVGQLDAIQEKYSMIDRRLDREHLPYCSEHGIAAIAYSPMELGLLTGKITPDRVFDDADFRKDDPRYAVEKRVRVRHLLDAIEPVARAHQLTLAQLAVAWCVHQPGLTHAIVGGRSPQQAAENAVAGRLVLTESQLAMIDDAIAEHARGLEGWRPPPHPARVEQAD